jgi:hypothetical protein
MLLLVRQVHNPTDASKTLAIKTERVLNDHRQSMNYCAALIPVDSSAIRAVGYDGSTLAVEFHNGRIYDHPDVPGSIFEDFMRASSKGAYYNQYIRGRYK